MVVEYDSKRSRMGLHSSQPEKHTVPQVLEFLEDSKQWKQRLGDRLADILGNTDTDNDDDNTDSANAKSIWANLGRYYMEKEF